MKKLYAVLLMALLTGCTQADKVKTNLRKEADDFNIRRRLTVFNTRSDKVLLQMEGLMSVSSDSDGDLNIVVEYEEDTYSINYVHLSENVTYLVEQLSAPLEVSKYAYEIHFYPEAVKSGLLDIVLDEGEKE